MRMNVEKAIVLIVATARKNLMTTKSKAFSWWPFNEELCGSFADGELEAPSGNEHKRQLPLLVTMRSVRVHIKYIFQQQGPVS